MIPCFTKILLALIRKGRLKKGEVADLQSGPPDLPFSLKTCLLASPVEIRDLRR
jgi:hypothetical protein